MVETILAAVRRANRLLVTKKPRRYPKGHAFVNEHFEPGSGLKMQRAEVFLRDHPLVEKVSLLGNLKINQARKQRQQKHVNVRAKYNLPLVAVNVVRLIGGLKRAGFEIDRANSIVRVSSGWLKFLRKGEQVGLIQIAPGEEPAFDLYVQKKHAEAFIRAFFVEQAKISQLSRSRRLLRS